jgi:murein DD-endopeptidase MepM/ murein hydrolase activator NlpD
MQLFWRRGSLLTVAVLTLGAAGVAGGMWIASRRPPAAGTAASRRATAPGARTAAPAAQPAQTEQRITIPPRSTFLAAIGAFHLDAALARQLVAAARPMYNLARVQAGHQLDLVRTLAGVPEALGYQIDAGHTLWLRAPASAAATAPWSASIEAIPFVTRLVGVAGTVETSLFQAVEQAGEHDMLAVDLANIFGWDLDFYTDTRPGDIFRVLVEKRFRHGQFAGYGQIVAAEYVNAGHPYEALRFHDRGGFLAYYQPNGRPMKREFLRSPLKFDARISSGFSYHRWQPILKYYRPHLGTDFAAPTGTPVQALGAGVVIQAGRYGEDGNMVRLRHPGGYETAYLHLSRILVHVGERVSQGQRIGLVGMTGLATGPNLHFAIQHDGKFLNFETLRKSLPPGAPVPASLRPQFDALRSRYLPELERLQPAPAVATAAAPPARNR